MLVAPRVGFSLPVDQLIDRLCERCPIDRNKVFLVGHSMGAAFAVRAASFDPKRYAAVAVIGGSGVFRASEEIKQLPFHLSVGAEDFALTGSRRLRDALSRAGVRSVKYQELRNVEHLGVVQQSLESVFQFFDLISKG